VCLYVRARFFFTKGTHMPSIQLERLKNDLIELDTYAKKLMEKGRSMEAKNILKKRDFMMRTLTSQGVQILS
jgi:hypothetical protein